MDLLTKAIQIVDLPALVLELFPDSGAVPNKSGKILAAWRGEKNESASLFLKDDVGPWLLKDHATGECVNAFSFLLQMADYDKQSAAEKLIRATGLEEEKSQKKEIVATYDYTDEEGNFLFQTVRFKPKSFAQRVRDGANWIWKLGSTRRVLFRLPEVKKAIAESAWLFLLEGEEDVLTVEKYGFVGTTCPMGANKWRTEYIQSLAGAILIISPDNDKVGLEHSQKVAREVYGTVKEIKIIELPGLKDKEDITDWFRKGHTAEELHQIVKNTNPFEISDLQKTDEQVINKPEKVVIQVNHRHLHEISDDAIKALRASNNPPRLYIRSKLLSRVDPDGKAQIMDNASLKGYLDRCAKFVTIKTQNEQKNILPARPPTDLAPDLLSLEPQKLGLPELERVSTVPIFDAQGRLLTKNGYDAESKTLLILDGLKDFKFELYSIPKALKILHNLIVDFPFAFQNGIAHTLAMFLQHFIRPMINGPTPLYLAESPTRGTGKGKLCNIPSLIITGKDAPLMTLPRTGEEMEKRITSNLLEGHLSILIDNVNQLGGDELAAILTTEWWSGRRLGTSQILHVRNNALWQATGNNVDLLGDIARRVIPIRLDAGVEKPEERKEFKHPDLKGYILQNRNEIICACLSLILHWANNGYPKGSKTLGRGYCAH